MTASNFMISNRPRRLRKTSWLRDLVAEHNPHVNDLIWPVFVHEHETAEAGNLPGVFRYSIADLVTEVAKARDMGIKAIAIFPVTEANLKDEYGAEALNPGNLVCRAIAEIKQKVPDIGIIADVALDPYTSHGHDGVLDKNGDIANDATIAILQKQALVLANAGADIVAPSDMMDGRIGLIRSELDLHNHQNTAILAYSAKYASAFYGPFRSAVGSKSALKGADKRSYQMHPANIREAVREVELDISEAADMVMVKPGLHYLDVIKTVKDQVNLPVFAYHVSGEYAMLKTAVNAGFINEEDALLETMLAFKRAGCDGVLTYAARDIAKLIGN